MKKRGTKFWLWSDCQLQSTLRRVTADCGIQIELQARSSRKSIIQLFVGVYDGRGLPLVEEYYAHCPEESVTQALEWGQKRAHFLTESISNKPRSRIWPISLRDASNDALARSQIETTWSRAAFMNQAQAAQARYQKACRAMVDIMKKTKVAKEDWEKCRVELNAAIDQRAAVLRLNGLSMYLGSEAGPLSEPSACAICSDNYQQPCVSQGHEQQYQVAESPHKMSGTSSD
ncbi:hypothetical protein BWR59_03655 [Pseudomonas sp. Bc-h]|uniref:hypothetical protein n=1 Tax=Pseudomonas sp. Bc-h TaxID=1943632 RepID=UPI0009DB3F66|nr:hypothetical protein [Pseudomonas sp. Bc-h]OQR36773.1 hypothetical protein BWR59_03655 [Pseudomonas sp. Bc-h]